MRDFLAKTTALTRKTTSPVHQTPKKMPFFPIVNSKTSSSTSSLFPRNSHNEISQSVKVCDESCNKMIIKEITHHINLLSQELEAEDSPNSNDSMSGDENDFMIGSFNITNKQTNAVKCIKKEKKSEKRPSSSLPTLRVSYNAVDPHYIADINFSRQSPRFIVDVYGNTYIPRDRRSDLFRDLFKKYQRFSSKVDRSSFSYPRTVNYRQKSYINTNK
eukprot:Tbor_TRINITY_DN4067_c0_g1::TRINITY_DN4067_c0_g1_i1::g.11719::m.11719